MSRSATVVASLAAAVVAVAAVALVGAAAPAKRQPATPTHHVARATPAPTAGTFVSVGAFRALGETTVRAGRQVNLTVAGRHGIPANAAAVVVTVHAAQEQGAGSLTLFPAGTAAPATTNLTYVRGQGTAQAAVVRLGHGAVTILDRARTGSLRLAVDVRGYLAGGTVDTTSPGLLHMLASPVRRWTPGTRAVLPPHSVRTMRVAHGVPTRGVGAVAVMLTANDPAASGSLVAYAAGNDQPSVPTTRFDAHRTTTSFAWVPTHSDGSISIANTSHGATGVLLDIVGWANTGVARTAGALSRASPTAGRVRPATRRPARPGQCGWPVRPACRWRTSVPCSLR